MAFPVWQKAQKQQPPINPKKIIAAISPAYLSSTVVGADVGMGVGAQVPLQVGDEVGKGVGRIEIEG